MFFRFLRRGGWFLGGCGGCGGSVGRSFAVILLLAVYIMSVSVFWTLSGDLQASNEVDLVTIFLLLEIACSRNFYLFF